MIIQRLVSIFICLEVVRLIHWKFQSWFLIAFWMHSFVFRCCGRSLNIFNIWLSCVFLIIIFFNVDVWEFSCIIWHFGLNLFIQLFLLSIVKEDMFRIINLNQISELYSESAEGRYQSIVDKFVKEYGEKPAFIARAPGRVNIIGEHIDY